MWDKIRAALAEAAETTASQAGGWRNTVHDAAVGGWERAASAGHEVSDHVRTGAHVTADAVRTGAAAVGRGVAAVDDGIERTANGIVAGAIAGALAAWVMNQYQAASAEPKQPAGASGPAAGPSGPAGSAASATGGGPDATVQVAEHLSREVFGHELTPGEKPAAGAGVHYGYGAVMGALYGGLAEIFPSVSRGLGIPYGTALWLFGDEIAVPALGLGKPPTATKPAEHAAALSSHFVYGITLDIARRVLRHIV